MNRVLPSRNYHSSPCHDSRGTTTLAAADIAWHTDDNFENRRQDRTTMASSAIAVRSPKSSWDSPSYISSPAPTAVTSAPVIPPFVDDSTWQERAVCFFFDQFTETGRPDGFSGHMEYLPGLYARCQDDEGSIFAERCSAASCLRWAVNATSLIALGNRKGSKELCLQAKNQYGLVLRGLRQALTSQVEAMKDETFATVVLLLLFEEIAGERIGLSSSHTAGLEALMELRGRSQFGREEGRALFQLAYTHKVCLHRSCQIAYDG